MRVLLLISVLSLVGCAGLFGVTPDGEPVAGGVGTLIKTAAPFLPPPWNTIATAAAGMLAGAGVLAAAKKKTKVA